MTTHDEFVTWDGAYLLGALSSADRRAYEEHLRTCDACTAAVSELAGLPGLLGHVSEAEAFALLEADQTAGQGVPQGQTTSIREAERLSADGSNPDLLGGLLRAARRRRIRTRWWAAGSLAAAAVIVVLSAIVVSSLLMPTLTPAPEAGKSVVMTQVEPSGLSADIKLVAEPWGTRIESRCSYADWDGQAPGRSWTYAMVVTDRNGRETQISTWEAAPGTTVEPTATTSVAVADIASVDIRSAANGTVLLQSTFD
ncbi:anti-sigma factor family protein [Leifsonia sp. NPDC058230]|uniref:anti-sigma factor family protein n=1 Tax=Leifsonia sp. NPDC058230 TaxID=3346391 RepID=UPI0036D8127E